MFNLYVREYWSKISQIRENNKIKLVNLMLGFIFLTPIATCRSNQLLLNSNIWTHVIKAMLYGEKKKKKKTVGGGRRGAKW